MSKDLLSIFQKDGGKSYSTVESYLLPNGMKRTGLPSRTGHYALWPSDIGGNDIELRNPGVFMTSMLCNLRGAWEIFSTLNNIAASST